MKKINIKKGKLLSCSKIIICILIGYFLIAFKTDGYTINANIDGPDGTVIKLSYEYNGKVVHDSSTIKNNKLRLKGSLPEAVICTLANSVNQQTKVIVFQNEKVKIQGTVAKFYYSKVSGARENDLYTAFKDKSINLTSDYRMQLQKSKVDFYDRTSSVYLEFHRRLDSLTLAFVKANPDAVASSLAIISSHLNSTGFLKAENCYNFLSKNAKNGYYAKRIKSFVDASKAVTIGKQASNVILKDIAGNKFDLSQYRGKYVLLDFWASWCKPCREEHPLLRKLNEDFKSKNIVFVSVSMEADQKSWRHAVAEDDLSWIQLNDPLAMRGPLAEAYALKALPFNCVVNPQGEIIGTKLRGERLRDFLIQLFRDDK